ncbi:MAG: hypothetical protein WAT12_12735, partial [Candidatus Nitrotoga sp.]
MLIWISCSILFISALALIVLRVTQQNSRYAWWTAMGGATLTTISIFIWQTQMPFGLNLLAWQPDKLFVNPISFHADGISWPLALSIVTLTLTSMLTSVA